jgi:hypothetical protein
LKSIETITGKRALFIQPNDRAGEAPYGGLVHPA